MRTGTSDRGDTPISVSGSTLRQLAEAWHGIRLSESQAEELARADAVAARTVAVSAESLSLRDQPSRFRSVLGTPDERAD